LKPLDFDLDLQCIDKGDNYWKEIDAMRMNMNNQKVNSLNNNVNSEEQENNEKLNWRILPSLDFKLDETVVCSILV
jgi:ribosome-binding factor A